MREMKDSGIEWIGEIPAAWQVSKIKYFFDCLDGKRVPVDAGERISGPYPYWGAGSVTDYVNDYLFDEELILLGEDGAPFFDYTRPVAFLVNEKIWVNNHIHVLKPHRSVCPSYLVHYLNNVDYKTYINGSILNKLTQSNMNTIAFVVPPYEEQVRIAAFLDRKCAEIDAVIERTKATIEEYKKLKQSIITEAVTKGIRGDRPMKESGIEWIGDIPFEWDCMKVSRIATVARGASPRPAGDSKYFNGSYIPWITVAEVTNSDGIYINSTETYLTEEGSKCSRIVEAGTLLLSNSGATLGVPKITNIKGCINDGSVAFYNLNIGKKYLLYVFASYTEELRKQRQGYGQPNLNTDLIKALYVPKPSTIEQQEIVDYLDVKCAEIDTLIAKKTALLEEMESYKKSVIYEYVTGKKEVK